MTTSTPRPTSTRRVQVQPRPVRRTRLRDDTAGEALVTRAAVDSARTVLAAAEQFLDETVWPT